MGPFQSFSEIHAQNVSLGNFKIFCMLTCFLSLAGDFQLHFLKDELTAHSKSSGPFCPKVYPHDIANKIHFDYPYTTIKS